MKRFILYRLLQFIPAILGVTFVTFGLMHMAPGDPIDTRLSSAGIAADPAMVQALRDSFGLNDSFWVQYGRWLGHFVQGDMGISYITDQSVSHLLGAALPYTIVMALVAMVITLAVSVPVGMYLANRQHSRIDTGVRWLTFLGNSIPNFIIAIFLLLDNPLCVVDIKTTLQFTSLKFLKNTSSTESVLHWFIIIASV